MSGDPGGAPVFAGRRKNLEDLRRIVAESRGPREVLAIVNGGDGDLVQAEIAAQVPRLFRRDGGTAVFAHEEATRRGQLLGLLDALRGHDVGHRGGVALGLMMPGKGTRLSPLTQRLYGIKPFLPTLLRPDADGGFLHGAAASLWTWTLVVHHLERCGFEGVAWKWGDEPQIPAAVLAGLDLSDADAVRFGAETRVTEDLARNKEWLFRDPSSGRLLRQVRRRPRADLLAAFGIANPELDVRALVHVGSPAFSRVFLDAAEEAFGDVEGWLDVDGYLFEALTSDPRTWDSEVARDPGLQALLARHPDFPARVEALATGIRARRGRPPVVKVVDLGEGLYWGDVGQLAKARESLRGVLDAGEEGRFARLLAAIDDAPCDRHGNRVVGESRIPDDGRVRGSVVIDARLDGPVDVENALVVRSDLGRAVLCGGSVVVESTVADLEAGEHAFVFRAVGARVDVAAHGVYTDIPADPADVARGLEAWRADAREDVGSEARQTAPAFGNPTSFAEKFRQMRGRTFDPRVVEAAVDARFRTKVRAAITRRDAARGV